MAESHVKGLLKWARDTDQGICQLELLVERNGILNSEIDPNEVLQKFEYIFVDARTIKELVQEDLDKLKSISEDLKEVIASTEDETVTRIDKELKAMLNSVFPVEAAGIVEEPVSTSEIEIDNRYTVQDEDKESSAAGATALLLSPNVQSDESYTEVEITPGLVNKIPKSRFETKDVISSERDAPTFLRPLRKRTLVFSPGTTPRSPLRQPFPQQIVLQNCSNWNNYKDSANF